jgi:hypothetical protein
MSGEFLKIIRKLDRKTRSVRQGDEVLMGVEKMQVAAQSQKGSALLVVSGSWRILFVSQWDAGLFTELLQNNDNGEIHAVFLPAGRAGQSIPDEFLEWLDRVKPLLVILPGPQPVVTTHLVSRHIPHLDLKSVGALSFQRNGNQLELRSFVNGLLGAYSYL